MSPEKLRALEGAILEELQASVPHETTSCALLAERFGGSPESLAVRQLLGELDSAGVVEIVEGRVRLAGGARHSYARGALRECGAGSQLGS